MQRPRLTVAGMALGLLATAAAASPAVARGAKDIYNTR
jgi:hypothetical protein